MIFLALKTEDGRIARKITFYCRMFGISQQGFYKYPANKNRPWKYQGLADAMKSDNLLKRDLHSDAPLEKCITDITEIPVSNGKLYVSVIFDCFDLSVLGLAMETNMKADLCIHTRSAEIRRLQSPSGTEQRYGHNKYTEKMALDYGRVSFFVTRLKNGEQTRLTLMLKNNIEVDVKVKCIEAETTQAKLAEDVGTTPSYVNRLIKKSENIVNKTFIQMLESLGYDVELTYVKREEK